MDTTPQQSQPSPYRVGNWTITQLKEELKQKNLSPAGRKQELIDRLERYESDAQLATPRRRRARSPTRSPSKARARSVSKKRVINKSSSDMLEQSLDAPMTTPRRPGRPRKNPQHEWIHTPLKLTQTPPRQSPASVAKSTKSTPRARTPLKRTTGNPSSTLSQSMKSSLVSLAAALLFGAVIFAIFMIPGFDFARQIVLWYAQWVLNGVISVLGIGSASNTWQLNMAPLIAKIASKAYSCGSLDFYSWNIVCPKDAVRTVISPVSIFLKVYNEVLAWGVGSAIGEMVVLILATFFVRALKISVASNRNSKISSKILAVLAQAKKTFGPSEALIFACLPNPVFETTGLLCGLLEVPVEASIRAIFVGKALISTSIQAAVLIAIASNDLIAMLTTFIGKFSPALVDLINEEIAMQRKRLLNCNVQAIGVTGTLRSAFKLVNLALLVFFAVHALITMIKYRRSLW